MKALFSLTALRAATRVVPLGRRAHPLCQRFASRAVHLYVGRGGAATARLSVASPGRFYGAAAGVTLESANERVLAVLKKFDKVDAAKLALTTPFTQLGLDSLDVVEVMIALEEEFHMEIPDPVADKAQTPREIAEYIHGFLNPHRPPPEDHMSEQTGGDH